MWEWANPSYVKASAVAEGYGGQDGGQASGKRKAGEEFVGSFAVEVWMGTRSEQGSRNIGIFTSLTQTAKLQESSILDLFRNLLTGTAAKAQDILFTNSS